MLPLIVFASLQYNSYAVAQAGNKPRMTLEAINAHRKAMNDDLISLKLEAQEVIGRGKQLNAMIEHAKVIAEQKRREAEKPAAPE